MWLRCGWGIVDGGRLEADSYLNHNVHRLSQSRSPTRTKWPTLVKPSKRLSESELRGTGSSVEVAPMPKFMTFSIGYSSCLVGLL